MSDEEQDIVVEEPEQQEEEKTSVASAPEESELDSYSKGVQNRIKKLTEKYRQEERDKAEAVRVSTQLLEENKKLKSRVQALDTGYLSEYGTRIESQTDAAKRAYKEAYEAGDTDRMLEAQQALSNIAIETQRYNTAKARVEQAKVQVQRNSSSSNLYNNLYSNSSSKLILVLKIGPQKTIGLARTRL
jgi:transposase